MKACAFCTGIASREVFSDERLIVVKCSVCGLVQQKDYEGALSRLTPVTRGEEYYQSGRHAKFEFNSLRSSRTADIQVKIAMEFKPQAPVLDIGCGNGEFLYALRELEVPVIGVEPNPEKALIARDELGLNVITSLYEESLFPSNSFDVITLIQVLEHVMDPLEILRVAHDHLRQGGHMVIDVPSYNNPRFLLYRATKAKRFVQGDFIPTHNFYYTRKTLTRIVESAGFAVLEAVTGRYSVKYGYKSRLLKSLFFPIDSVANLLGVGGITLYAQKSVA